ncbi:thioesterase II family protein [Streptomyces monashensis]|uniref:Thioesterase domain-containing protein n=1 Tax=Streptomyces monashensis TaxID=1678012 RepID=A0A1S2QI04_9ACTN|nr:thioesterase domain-containing protein [Streptomyces monashensis]OIK05293.1 hypothetical protein BIV23_13645 [Streptomyces monashensis]
MSRVRTLTAVEDPLVRLVCFPHSGGSATAFRGWAAALPPGAELVAVQYPGRGDRFAGPLVDDVAETAGRAVAELIRLPSLDQVLFGHGLGALVAYETAMLLRAVGREPLRLCVSACLPPGHLKDLDVHPTLRSDLRAHARYRPGAGTTPLACPLTCYHGAGDPLVDGKRMTGWAGVTSGAFTPGVRPGGHIHVPTDVAGLVSDVLDREAR